MEVMVYALCIIGIIAIALWWLDVRKAEELEAKEEEAAYRKMRQEDEGFDVVEPRP